ncbi:MAG: tyrosine--tRNA ligase [Candidatus Nanopelagicales bacterium]|nr:tyrosine--tRNA ligase [Candidatus Nanopelagicales bacterium]MCF8538788.1 tyrosine--tRNA ligase [Candidatus Nanopelagicales bacterium]
MNSSPSDIIPELQWRGLIAQSTDIDALAKATSSPITLYCGFDPTAPSLHLGNLVQILTVRRFQLCGHKPLALVGGATGLIGDPKQSGERTLNSREVVSDWVDRIREQLTKFYSFEGVNAAQVVNNLDWTADMGVLEFMRDIGKHFSVNRMLDREAVAARLAKDGISFTEFSYQLLQSYDYLQLFKRYSCVLQTGGSDQWGNITAGVDLVRRVEQQSVHALTTPLITKADGTKFGKTESGTVWLDPELTSPYAFYQFWLNADDRDISSLLRIFSFKDQADIELLEQQSVDKPQERAAQRALAQELTTLVHGEAECAGAEAASRALFGGGDLSELPEATVAAALTEASLGEVSREEITDGLLPALDDLLVRAGLAASKKAARRTISEGGAYVNNIRVEHEDYQVPVSDLLYGSWLVLRRGRKAFAGVVVK